LIARPLLMSTLNLTPLTRGYLSFMMLVMSYFVVAQAYNTTIVVGIFRGGGDTKFGLFLDVTTMWGGSILFGALSAFVFKWSVPIVYIILMSDEIIKIPLIFWRYKCLKWLRNVTRD
ncbi:MAG TPA: MATE family efflux transporter, partial [Ruminiclostridium sp.]|nr:MATE family efflux transporter [Ruminiclostridium sp.]